MRLLSLLSVLVAVNLPYIWLLGTAIPVGHLALAVLACMALFLLLGSEGRSLFSDPAVLFFLLSVSLISMRAWLGGTTSSYIDFKASLLFAEVAVTLLVSFLFSRPRFMGGQFLRRFEHALIISLLANTLVIYLCYFSDAFKQGFYSIFAVNPKVFEYPVERHGGFLYDGFSYSSVLLAISLMSVHITRGVLGRQRTSFSFFVLTMIAAPALLLAGRFGGFLLVVYLLVFLGAGLLRLLRTQRIRTLKSRGLLLIPLSLGVVYLVTREPTLVYLIYAMSALQQIFLAGDFSDSTLVELSQNHYYLSDRLSDLLIGSGYLFSGDIDFNAVDPGVVRLLNGMGVPVTIVYFAGFLIAAAMVWKRRALPLRSRLGFVILSLFFAVLLPLKDAYIFYPVPHFVMYFALYLGLKQITLPKTSPEVNQTPLGRRLRLDASNIAPLPVP